MKCGPWPGGSSLVAGDIVTSWQHDILRYVTRHNSPLATWHSQAPRETSAETMPGYVGPKSPTNMIILEETKKMLHIIVLSICLENSVFLYVLCRFIWWSDDMCNFSICLKCFLYISVANVQNIFIYKIWLFNFSPNWLFAHSSRKLRVLVLA